MRRAHESGSRYGNREKKREVSAPPVIQPSRDTRRKTGNRTSRLSESGNNEKEKNLKEQIKDAGNIIIVDDGNNNSKLNENNNNNQNETKKLIKKSRDRSQTREKSQTRDRSQPRNRERSVNRDRSVNRENYKESSVPRIIDSGHLRKETHISATIPDNILNPGLGQSPPGNNIQNLNNLIRGSSVAPVHNKFQNYLHPNNKITDNIFGERAETKDELSGKTLSDQISLEALPIKLQDALNLSHENNNSSNNSGNNVIVANANNNNNSNLVGKRGSTRNSTGNLSHDVNNLQRSQQQHFANYRK